MHSKQLISLWIERSLGKSFNIRRIAGSNFMLEMVGSDPCCDSRCRCMFVIYMKTLSRKHVVHTLSQHISKQYSRSKKHP